MHETLVLPLISSWTVKSDPLKRETVMVQPNHVRVLILTKKYDRDHASMDIFVERANKPVFLYLQMTVIFEIWSQLKILTTQLVR